jgi:hypothetical protein
MVTLVVWRRLYRWWDRPMVADYRHLAVVSYWRHDANLVHVGQEWWRRCAVDETARGPELTGSKRVRDAYWAAKAQYITTRESTR